MAADPVILFAAIAGIIFLGFAGSMIFKKLKFNDTLLLIFVGVLIGPILQWVPASQLAVASAIIGPLALILILFDGGLALEVESLRKGLMSSVVLSIVGFGLSTLFVAIVLHYLINVAWLPAIALSSIVGGTSALVVLTSLENMTVSQKVKTILGLESALTDVLVVVVAFSLLSVIQDQGSVGFAPIGRKLAITFLMSLFLGIVAAFVWLRLIRFFQDLPFSYMLTLGAMFFVYSFVEFFLKDVSTGGGPLAVLCFGAVLANTSSLPRGLQLADNQSFKLGIRRFQGEISFLVRTFFFVYLGILIELKQLADLQLIAISILAFAALAVARYFAVFFISGRYNLAGGAKIIWVMGPRGLAAAVLAAEAANRGIPGAQDFVAIAFMILLLTNVQSTVGTLLFAGKKKERQPEPKFTPVVKPIPVAPVSTPPSAKKSAPKAKKSEERVPEPTPVKPRAPRRKPVDTNEED